MPEEIPPLDESARQAADLLALALEDAGFDVGMDFPGLRSGWDASNSPGVHLGSVRHAVASELAAFIARAVSVGVSIRSR